MRIKGIFVIAIAAGVAGVVGPPAAAAAALGPGPAEPQAIEHQSHYQPAARVGTEATGGGGRSGDFTGDGTPDILARDRTFGDLLVYPHSGTYNGTATYPSSVFINAGWGRMTWLSAADLSGDGFADVVAVDSMGTMWVARHSGTFDGQFTLEHGLTLINENWGINDLVFPFDVNADGFDDLLARRRGTGDTYVYLNSGGINGRDTLLAPQLLVSGGANDVYQGMADVTLDGSPDLVFVQDDGVMGVHSFVDGTYSIGFGWRGIDRVVLTEANLDGLPDILGRRTDGTLQAYTHTGSWAPAPDRTAYGTLRAPVVMGFNWQIHNIIT